MSDEKSMLKATITRARCALFLWLALAGKTALAAEDGEWCRDFNPPMVTNTGQQSQPERSMRGASCVKYGCSAPL